MIHDLAEAGLSLFALLTAGGLLGSLAWPLTDTPTRPANSEKETNG